LVIFVIIFSKCSVHFAFWERTIPRCLWLVDKGIILPLKENSRLSVLPVLEKKHDLCFSGLNAITYLIDQVFSSSRSWLIAVCFIWTTLWLEYPSDVLSANNILNEIRFSPISFMYVRNMRGPILTPDTRQLRQVRNLRKSYYLLFAFFCIDSFRTILIFPWIPYESILWIIPVPNLVESFRKIAKDETAKKVSLRSYSWWTVECLGKNPDWYLYMKLLLSRWS
jgi:hypothetical protein